ncbi:MAG: hypothetical protein JWM19_4904 [Actinomycetia bacterium]|nr:hypothetical protein [Actinomycetes bacterium]
MALPKMALLSRIMGSRIVRYGFVVVAVGLGAYGVAAEWGKIGPALGRIGVPISLASLALTLAALVASMWTWRVLLAGLGSPLPFGVAARVMFIGQLGKYLPGAVGPVLAQMELATAHGVPRSRTASAGLVNMPVSVLSALLAALVSGDLGAAQRGLACRKGVQDRQRIRLTPRRNAAAMPAGAR